MVGFVRARIAIEGVSLCDEEHVLIADDPRAFADAVIRLYRDETLWCRIQEAGYVFVEEPGRAGFRLATTLSMSPTRFG
jgi:hypothetical protein